MDCFQPASPFRHPDRSGGIAPCLQGAGYNLCKSKAFGWAKHGSLHTADGAKSLGSASLLGMTAGEVVQKEKVESFTEGEGK